MFANEKLDGASQVARYKHYDYKQMMMVPVSLEEQLIPATWPRMTFIILWKRESTRFFLQTASATMKLVDLLTTQRSC